MANSTLMPSSMPQPGVFKNWLSGPEDMGQLPAFFNSSLSTSAVNAGQNATMTIYLRLHLVKRNPNDIKLTEDGKPVELREWDDTNDEFGRFKNGVKQQADAFWDKTNFCLLPPPDYRALDTPMNNPRIRPNIDCRFEIVWASGPCDAHAVIDCVCPKEKFKLRSHVQGSYTGNGKGLWSCYDLELKGHDVFINGVCVEDAGDPLKPSEMKRRTVRCNKEVTQEAVCHEVGHLIGLPHVGVFFKVSACMDEIQKSPVHGNGANACYHGRNDADAQNIMGGGMNLATWNVMPWASRIVSHTGVSLQGWRVSMQKVMPKKLP